MYGYRAGGGSRDKCCAAWQLPCRQMTCYGSAHVGAGAAPGGVRPPQSRAPSKHQPPALRGPAAWGTGWYPALICSVHALVSSPPRGTPTMLPNQGIKPFLKGVYALETILPRTTVIQPWPLTWPCLYYQSHVGAENCLARGRPHV